MDNIQNRIKDFLPIILVILSGVINILAATALCYSDGVIRPILGIISIVVTIILCSCVLGYITVMRRQVKNIIQQKELLIKSSNNTYYRDKVRNGKKQKK